MDTPEEIVTYVVAGVQEREGTLGKTKLVKLLYLIDIELYARFRRTATGLPWRYYYFGPYANEIEDVLRRVDFDVPQEEVTTARGARAIVFRPANLAYLLDRVRLSDRVRSSADRVLREWALEDLYPILDHVYFHTEPMASASPGQTLDFSTIPMYEPPRLARALPPIAPDVLGGLKEDMARATADRLHLQQMAEAQRARLYRDDDSGFAALMRRFERTEEAGSNLEGVELLAPSWPEE